MSNKLTIPPEFDRAPDEQRIAFVQELWDRIAADPERVPVPAAHRRVLEDRLRAYHANPSVAEDWAEFRDNLLAKFRNT